MRPTHAIPAVITSLATAIGVCGCAVPRPRIDLGTAPEFPPRTSTPPCILRSAPIWIAPGFPHTELGTMRVDLHNSVLLPPGLRFGLAAEYDPCLGWAGADPHLILVLWSDGIPRDTLILSPGNLFISPRRIPDLPGDQGWPGDPEAPDRLSSALRVSAVNDEAFDDWKARLVASPVLVALSSSYESVRGETTWAYEQRYSMRQEYERRIPDFAWRTGDEQRRLGFHLAIQQYRDRRLDQSVTVDLRTMRFAEDTL